MEQDENVLYYQGHASLRIVTREGKVIYVDPYAGDGYDLPADLILITHGHDDHTHTELIGKRNPGCKIITWKEALDGGYRHFDFGFVQVETVEAGYNRNHDKKECVGYILTFSDGVSLYVSGDTSRTPTMARLAKRKLDYALFCADGVFNMDVEEAASCAVLVGARHSIPYHMKPGALFDRSIAERFVAPGRIILPAGTALELGA